MKTRAALRAWVVVVAVATVAVSATGHAQTNSWTSPTRGYWDDYTKWSLQISPTNTHSVYITNALTKTVTIDSITSGDYPESMTISSLTISGDSQSTNSLAVSNAGWDVPLQVLNGCSVSSGGSLVVEDSVVIAQGEVLRVDGSVVLNSGSIAANGGAQIGVSAPGTLTLLGGTFTASSLLGSASATVNLFGGVMQTGGTSLSNSLAVGNGTDPAMLRLLGGLHSFGSSLSISSNAQLTGCGTITSPVVNDGTMLLDCAGGTATFSSVVTNNGIIIATNGAALVFVGPVVNSGTIDASAGSVWFNSSVINSGTILPTPPPVAPTNLEAELTYPNLTNVYLTWQDNATDEAGFSIERCTNSTTFIEIAVLPVDSTSYMDTNGNVAALTNFSYRIRATNSVGYSAYSNIATASIWTVTNSWINSGDGFWQDAANWSLSQAPTNIHSILITNDSSKTVTIDATTSGSFSNTLTVSDVILSAPGGATNVLNLSNAGTNTPLHVLHTLSVADGAVLHVTNSALSVDGLVDGVFSVDGSLVVNSNSLLVAGGGLYVGLNTNAFGSVLLEGGQLALPNLPSAIGFYGSGQMIVSDGAVMTMTTGAVPLATVKMDNSLLVGLGCGSQGALTVAAGNYISSSYGRLVVGMETGATGTVSVTGGNLVITNSFITLIGGTGSGQLNLSGGTNTLGPTEIGGNPGSAGTLTVAGGVNNVQGALFVGASLGATGVVWMTGGQLIATNWTTWAFWPSQPTTLNWTTYVGLWGFGLVTVSNGNWLGSAMIVGSQSNSHGTVTVAGGSVTLLSRLVIGNWSNSLGAVNVAGGSLAVTNASIFIGNGGGGQMTISDGSALAGDVYVGFNTGSQGTLTVAGGVETISSSLVIGNCASGAVGVVSMAGGNLYVTNAAHTAFIDVRNGQLVLSGGVLQADTLVMTNGCGVFIRSGGTLIVSNVVLDPNLSALGDGIPNGWKQQYGFDPLDPAVANADPDGDGMSNLQEYLAGTDPTNSDSALRITSIVPQGDDILITWSAVTNESYIVQVTTNTLDGSFTNAFLDLATVAVPAAPPITETNYLDVGALTNDWSRFYRIRLATPP